MPVTSHSATEHLAPASAIRGDRGREAIRAEDRDLDEAPRQEVGTGSYVLVADFNVVPLSVGIDREPPPEP
jgi:hypothetical protein